MVDLVFEKELSQYSVYILYFYISNMPYHDQIIEDLDQLMIKYKIPFLSVNIDNFSKMKKQFNITSVPVIILIKDNEVLTSIGGFYYKKLLDYKLNDLIRGSDGKEESN